MPIKIGMDSNNKVDNYPDRANSRMTPRTTLVSGQMVVGGSGGVAYTAPVITTVQGDIPEWVVLEGVGFDFAATGGSGNYSWTANTLPATLILDTDGHLHGTVTDAVGGYTVEITCTDTTSLLFDTNTFTMTINETPLTPGEFNTYYAFDPAGVALAPDPDIGTYIDRGTAAIDSTIVFGIENVVAVSAGGNDVSRYNGLGMWYRSAADASGNMAEAAGTIAFVIKPNSLTAAIDILWGFENTLHGYLGLIPGSVSGYKVRANCGSGINAESGDLAFGTNCVAIMRWVGATLYVSVNGGAEVTAAAGGDCFGGSLAQRFQLFANGGGNEFNGDCLMALITPDTWVAADLYSRIVATFPEDL